MAYELANLEVDETSQDMYNEGYFKNITASKNGTSESSIMWFRGVDLGEFSTIITSLKANVTSDFRVYACDQESINSTQPHVHNRVLQLGSDLSVAAEGANGGYFEGKYKWIIITTLNGTTSNVTNAIAIDVFGKARG